MFYAWYLYICMLYLWQGREWPFVLVDAARCGWRRQMCVPVAPECQLKRMVAKFHCTVSAYHIYAGLHKLPKTLHRETATRGSITIACVDYVQRYWSRWPWETWAFIIYAYMLCFYLFDYGTEYVTLLCDGWTHSENTGQQILIPLCPNSVAPQMIKKYEYDILCFLIQFTSVHCNTTVKEVCCQWHILSHRPVGWGH
jgi:hypothetical protein